MVNSKFEKCSKINLLEVHLVKLMDSNSLKNKITPPQLSDVK
jgi:hypothetical protein